MKHPNKRIALLATIVFAFLLSKSTWAQEVQGYKELSRSQITDSVNLNQTGPEQWIYKEYRIEDERIAKTQELIVSSTTEQNMDSYFGTPVLVISVLSNSNKIRELSGHYYALWPIENESTWKLALITPFNNPKH